MLNPRSETRVLQAKVFYLQKLGFYWEKQESLLRLQKERMQNSNLSCGLERGEKRSITPFPGTEWGRGDEPEAILHGGCWLALDQGQGSVEAKSRLRDHHRALDHINSAITIPWQGAFNDSFLQVTGDRIEVSGPQSCAECHWSWLLVKKPGHT